MIDPQRPGQHIGVMFDDPHQELLAKLGELLLDFRQRVIMTTSPGFAEAMKKIGYKTIAKRRVTGVETFACGRKA